MVPKGLSNRISDEGGIWLQIQRSLKPSKDPASGYSINDSKVRMDLILVCSCCEA